jgi:hypothetical protein
MHKVFLNCIYSFITATILLSCSHHIKNDLDFAIGKDYKTHEVYYGRPSKIIKTNTGSTHRYTNIQEGCIYELDVNSASIVTSYRFIANKNKCAIPLNWGGPW